MLQEHAKVLYLLRLAGEIVGRKKLQKIVYITQKLKFDLNQRFYFHFYGPYSEELTLEVEEMVELGFLEELLEDKGNYNVYRYRLTENGHSFLAHSKVELEHMSTTIEHLNQLSSRFLELLSTVFYFEDLSRDEVEEKVFTLKAKSNYTKEEITEAYKWMEELRKI
ncbi:MAG TPA: YwgA family protein [Bacillota bacterium]|nr:YwgA family protein [Bacillota bacterium]